MLIESNEKYFRHLTRQEIRDKYDVEMEYFIKAIRNTSLFTTILDNKNYEVTYSYSVNDMTIKFTIMLPWIRTICDDIEITVNSNDKLLKRIESLEEQVRKLYDQIPIIMNSLQKN
jgi:hypothetical protein